MSRFTLRPIRNILSMSGIKGFGCKESGSVTVEAALWIPFFVLFTLGIGQLGLIFYGQARMLEVAQDANRSLAVGEFSSDQEAEEWIEKTLASLSPDARAESAIDGRIITTIVRYGSSL